MSKRALIVIDVQNDYFPGGDWELSGMNVAAENAAKLLTSARENGDFVVHVRHEFPDADAPFFRPGSKGAEINAVVQPQATEAVVVKHQINSFRDTNLKALLDENQVEEVVICGAMSHMCIDAATRAANDFGYKVNVIADACATRDAEFNGVNVPAAQVHAAYMAALGFAYATMHSTNEYVSTVEKTVKTP